MYICISVFDKFIFIDFLSFFLCCCFVKQGGLLDFSDSTCALDLSNVKGPDLRRAKGHCSGHGGTRLSGLGAEGHC